jgi:hypothetical protein
MARTPYIRFIVTTLSYRLSRLLVADAASREMYALSNNLDLYHYFPEDITNVVLFSALFSIIILKFNQNNLGGFLENRHFVFWDPCEGSLYVYIHINYR